MSRGDMVIEKELDRGFLDCDVDKFVQQAITKYENYFKVIDIYNEVCFDIKKEFTRTDVLMSDAYIYTIFNQIHTTFQSGIILTERGLCNDALVLLRTIYENIFKYKKVMKDSGYFNAIYLEMMNNKRSIYNKIKEKELFDFIDEDKLNKELANLDYFLKNKKNYPDKKNNFELAEDAEMVSQYIYYKILCLHSHNDLSNTLSCLKPKDDGVVIDGNFDVERIKTNLQIFIEAMQYAIYAITDYLNLSELKSKIDIANDLIDKEERNDY